MSRTVLIIVGVLILLMGVLALLMKGWLGVYDPWWHAVLKIIIGLVAIGVGYMDKK